MRGGSPVARPGQFVLVEIKPTRGRDEETAAAVLEVIARCWPAARPGPLISSFSRVALGVAKDRAPAPPRAPIAWRLPRDGHRGADPPGGGPVQPRGARRRAESPALLADEVFPHQPVRQWVLSFPFRLRFLFVSRQLIPGRVLGIVYRVVSMHLVKKAGYSRKAARTGAVTLIQRLAGPARRVH